MEGRIVSQRLVRRDRGVWVAAFETGQRSGTMLITVASTVDEVDAWVARQEPPRRVMGLDIEWRPARVGLQSHTSLLQLSAGDDVLLVQLLKFSRIPRSLTRLLEDGRVAKAGVGVDEDVRKLCQDWGVQVQGAVDLSAWRQEAQPGTRYLSLQKLVAAVLGADMCKDMRVTLSDWAAHTLTPKQIAYAALDAWVGGECCELMLADPAMPVYKPPPGA